MDDVADSLGRTNTSAEDQIFSGKGKNILDSSRADDEQTLLPILVIDEIGTPCPKTGYGVLGSNASLEEEKKRQSVWRRCENIQFWQSVWSRGENILGVCTIFLVRTGIMYLGALLGGFWWCC